MNIGSKYELKEIDIKNSTWYYFIAMTKIADFDLENTLILAKSNESILVITFNTKVYLIVSL